MRNLVVSIFAVILLTGCAVKQNLPPPATPPSAKSPVDPVDTEEPSIKEKIAGLLLAMGLVESACDMALKRQETRANEDKFARILESCNKRYLMFLDHARKIKAENREPEYNLVLDAIAYGLQAIMRTHHETRDCVTKSADTGQMQTCLEALTRAYNEIWNCIAKSASMAQMKTCLDKLGPNNTK